MSEVFGGPYKLFKKTLDDYNRPYEAVISICILNNNGLSERYYRDGTIQSTVIKKHTSLQKVVDGAIKRLEYLIQQEFYHPVDPLDLTTLQDLVKLTASTATVKPVV